MSRIGLMGGSFNPVHLGHLHLAQAALESGMTDSVLFLPSGNPPHKREGLADKLDRLAMVELAVRGQKGLGVCREEIDREGVIYTVDTLTRLRAACPGDHFIYLIGADTLHVLGTWRRAEEVVQLCDFLVLARDAHDEASMQADAERWRALGAQIHFLHAQMMDISSTQVRAAAAQGGEIGHLVPAAVADYIRAHALYQHPESNR